MKKAIIIALLALCACTQGTQPPEQQEPEGGEYPFPTATIHPEIIDLEKNIRYTCSEEVTKGWLPLIHRLDATGLSLYKRNNGIATLKMAYQFCAQKWYEHVRLEQQQRMLADMERIFNNPDPENYKPHPPPPPTWKALASGSKLLYVDEKARPEGRIMLDIRALTKSLSGAGECKSDAIFSKGEYALWKVQASAATPQFWMTQLAMALTDLEDEVELNVLGKALMDFETHLAGNIHGLSSVTARQLLACP